MKKIIIFIVSFFLCLNVYATDECTNSELQRLNELANNVTFRKSYKINADNEYKEINTISKYNYVVVNDDLNEAVRKVNSILDSEKCRVDRIEELDINSIEEVMHEDLVDFNE